MQPLFVQYRWALLCLLVLLAASFFLFPGHTYLQSDTQIYVPIMERLHDSAVLRDDMVAAKPHVAFTLYDETARTLRRLTGLDFQYVLQAQQVFYRLLGLLGAFLVGTGLGLSTPAALLMAGVYNLGATVVGAAVLTIEYEPVPRGFATPLLLLSLGLMAHRHMRAAAVPAALALLYHPPTAGPFLNAYGLLLFVPQADRRPLWQGVGIISMAALVLFLFSLPQQQLGEGQVFLARISAEQEALQRMRSSYNWVSLWQAAWFWHYLFLAAFSLMAMRQLRRRLPREFRAALLWLILFGLVSIPASYLLLEGAKWALVPQFQPARAALYLALFGVLLGVAAASDAILQKQPLKAFAFLFVAFALPVHTLVLQFASPGLWQDAVLARRLAITLGLTLAGLVTLRWAEKGPALSMGFGLATVVAASLLIPGWGGMKLYPPLHTPELADVAAWSRLHTPQNAVFLFPEAKKSLVPGVFRARALRTVYVDWKAGGQANFMKQFGEEWQQRWQTWIVPGLQPLPHYAGAGIDYIVVPAVTAVADASPAYRNSAYAVYAVPHQM